MLRLCRTDECPFVAINYAVVVFVNAGLYREANELPQRWTFEARRLGRESDPHFYALTCINRAEALWNLGRSDEALALLSKAEEPAKGYPFAEHGLRCLRAWVLVHQGAVDAAREAIDAVDGKAIDGYEPELFYTRAAIEQREGNLDVASKLANEGLLHARRASSERNGLFLLARTLLLQQRADEAQSLFERAVHHAYRGQGADGLFAWANHLEQMGEAEEARRVYGLIVERDPQSFLVEQARRRGCIG